MKNHILSDYATRKTAKKGRRFVVMLIDFFTLVIFSFLIFGAVVYPIFNNFSSVTEVSQKAEDEGQNLYKIVSETRLQSYSESSGSLVSIEDGGKDYVTSLMKTSFYILNKPYYEIEDSKKVEKTIDISDTFLYEKDGDSPKDNLSYYFLNFSVDKQIVSSRTRKQLNTDVLKLDSDNSSLVATDFDLDNDVFYLSSDNCDTLISYVNYGETDGSGETLYNSLLNFYASAVKTGIAEVEASYQPYLDSFAVLKKYTGLYSKYFNIAFIISYLVGFIITFVLFPCCFKNGKTVGYKFFGFGLVRNDQDKPRLINYILKDLVLLIDQFCAIFFMPLFLGRLNLLSFAFIGSITMFQLVIFSALVALISIVFFFISKDNQSLSEFASSTYTVDIKEHEEAVKDDKPVFNNRNFS